MVRVLQSFKLFIGILIGKSFNVIIIEADVVQDHETQIAMHFKVFRYIRGCSPLVSLHAQVGCLLKAMSSSVA